MMMMIVSTKPTVFIIFPSANRTCNYLSYYNFNYRRSTTVFDKKLLLAPESNMNNNLLSSTNPVTPNSYFDVYTAVNSESYSTSL